MVTTSERLEEKRVFTGIIEEIGTVEEVKSNLSSYRLRIKGEKVLEGTKESDSIAVNGVCLTVIEIGRESFVVQVMPQTLHKSNLKKVRKGKKINLERAASLNKKLGGHIVTGDVDGVGKINRIRREEGQSIWWIHYPSFLTKYIVSRGRITLDGVSLTVAKVKGEEFTVCLTPFTLNDTTFNLKKSGDLLNLEVDILSKYVEKIISPKQGIDLKFLKKAGY